MHYNGIRGKAQIWFRSYLTNRKQYVSFNGESPEVKQITCGVSGILSWTTFVPDIYINDLPNISEVLHFYLFADDTNIYYEAETMKQMATVINKKLNTWLIVNRLLLNIAKTNFLLFHPEQTNQTEV